MFSRSELWGNPPRSLRNVLFRLFHPRLVGMFWPDVGFEIPSLSVLSNTDGSLSSRRYHFLRVSVGLDKANCQLAQFSR